MISIEKCPECNGPLSSHADKGEIICYNCGLVIDDKMIRAELPFKSEEDGGGLDGVGPISSYTDVSMGTQTNVGNYSDLKLLPSKSRYRYERLRIWQNRTNISIERNFKFALSEIKRVISLLHQNQRVEEEAARIYREAAFKGLVRGRAIENVVAASVYAACRLYDTPVSLKDLETKYGASRKKEIGQTYRLIIRALNLKMVPQIPIDYVPKICSALNLSANTQTYAMEILSNKKDQKDHILSGKSPLSLAASAVYISSLINREKRTQQQIAQASGVTEVTLRNRYNDIIKSLDMTPEKLKKMRYKKVI